VSNEYHLISWHIYICRYHYVYLNFLYNYYRTQQKTTQAIRESSSIAGFVTDIDISNHTTDGGINTTLLTNEGINVGAVVGGVAAGLAILIAMIAIVMFLWKRREKNQKKRGKFI
jgi:preprotein translocase subunit YajC